MKPAEVGSRWIVVIAVAMLPGGACLTKDNPVYGLEDGGSTGATVDSTGVLPTPSPTETSRGDAGTTATGGDDGSTGDPAPNEGRCGGTMILAETFDADPMSSDQWTVGVAPTVSASTVDGQLRVGFEVLGQDNAYWVMQSADALPPIGTLGFEVVTQPDPVHPVQALIGLTGGGLLLQFSVANGFLSFGWWDGAQVENLASVDYDAVGHRWLRLHFDADAETADAEVSHNGSDWELLFSTDISRLGGHERQAHFSVGTWMGPVLDDDVATVDNAFVCTGS